MSKLSKLTWKKVGKGVGKVVDNKWTKLAAAGALGMTGVGAPLAAGIVGGMSAGGKLAQGKRLSTAVKGGVVDGGLTYVGGKLAGKVGGMFKGGPAPIDMTAANQASNAINSLDMGKVMSGGGGNIVQAGIGNAAKSAVSDPSRFRSIASSAGKFLGGKDGFGMDDVMDIGKFAGGAYDDYKTGQREDELYNTQRADYASRAPLRAAGMEGLLASNQRPDLSSTFATPEQRYRRVNIGSRV